MLKLEKADIPKRPPGCELENVIVAGSFPLYSMVCLSTRALRIRLILSRFFRSVFCTGVHTLLLVPPSSCSGYPSAAKGSLGELTAFSLYFQSVWITSSLGGWIPLGVCLSCWMRVRGLFSTLPEIVDIWILFQLGILFQVKHFF